MNGKEEIEFNRERYEGLVVLNARRQETLAMLMHVWCGEAVRCRGFEWRPVSRQRIAFMMQYAWACSGDKTFIYSLPLVTAAVRPLK